MSLPYLRKNRVNVYSLRFNFPLYRTVKHELLLRVQNRSNRIVYRQVCISLGVRTISEARELYFRVMSDAHSVLNRTKKEVSLMYSEEQQQAAIKQFKNQVQELIEAAKDSTAPVWMADLRAWQLRQTQKSLFKAISESETNRSQAAKELSRTKAILETVSAPIAPATSLSAPVTVAATKHILQDELAKYLAHKKSDWNKRSAIQAEANLLRFVEIIGTETNCEDITFDDIERYNTVMANLPPNAGKLRQKATLTTPDEIREFWELAATGNTGTKLLPNGIEKHYSVVRGFLKRLFITRRTDSDLAALLVMAMFGLTVVESKRACFR